MLGVEGSPAEVAARVRDLLGIERVVVSRRVADGDSLRRESAAVDGDGTAEATSPPFRASRAGRRGRRLLRRAAQRPPGRRPRRAGSSWAARMAAVKQSVPGDAPVVGLEELELALAEDPRMRR